MSTILQRLMLEAYRGIAGLELNELSPVSLIVGANNAGKSSILEAAGLLLRPPDPGQWVSAVRRRDADLALVDRMVENRSLAEEVLSQKAAKRISAVKGSIDSVLPNATVEEKDLRFAVHAAYDFANQLRRRRNDASHAGAGYGFGDHEEAEEFLISAGRHLPNVWCMARRWANRSG